MINARYRKIVCSLSRFQSLPENQRLEVMRCSRIEEDFEVVFEGEWSVSLWLLAICFMQMLFSTRIQIFGMPVESCS